MVDNAIPFRRLFPILVMGLSPGTAVGGGVGALAGRGRLGGLFPL